MPPITHGIKIVVLKIVHELSYEGGVEYIAYSTLYNSGSYQNSDDAIKHIHLILETELSPDEIDSENDCTFDEIAQNAMDMEGWSINWYNYNATIEIHSQQTVTIHR